MISIDILPDDVLLEIFDFHLNEYSDEDLVTIEYKIVREQWQTLVHVCRRWRSVVFGSPRRLNLRLVCTQGTPTRNTLDLWPSLPLVIRDSSGQRKNEDVDEIIAVLERRDRVIEIILIFVDCSNLENILAAMQATFPELTRLILSPYEDDGIVSVLPDSFLGGSAPRLEFLLLDRIPFPGLPKLLLSATHLVRLRLENIPHSGYISPEVMVTALPTLTSLEQLWLEFDSPQSYPDQASRRPPPLTCSVLPALTSFRFKGVGEYSDNLVARIDTPQLKSLRLTFFNQVLFDTPHFIQFMSRTPALKVLEKALVRFTDGDSKVNLSSQAPGGTLDVKVPCKELDWQVSSMEQVCTSCLPPLSTLEDLYIYEKPVSPPIWQDNIENALWLELLQPFTAVKNLYLSEKFASRIMPALRDLVEGRSTELLPVLQNIFLEELQPSPTVQATIQQFFAARQVTSHPIAVSRWDDAKEVMDRQV
jgi:F-box-like